MALLSIPFTFSAGAVIIASQHNQNFNTIYADYSGNIQDINIASNAAISYNKLSLSGLIQNSDLAGSITDSKLNQITTAGKVSGTAITGLASLPSGAGIIPSANISVSWVPSNIQVFTITGTWTKPANVSNVYVKVIGAGGNGGSTNSQAGASGGGGGGGYAEGIIAVTGNVTVTIGSTNSFAGTTTIQATAGSNGGNGGTSTVGTGGAGGVGSNGTINTSGGQGQPGIGVSATTSSGGPGGSTNFGAGGAGGLASVNSGVGISGSQFGGGGGGSSGVAGGHPAGGSGDAGAVIVYY